MVDLGELQKILYQNKVAKGFNVTDIYKEFCYTLMKKKQKISW